VSTLYCAGFAAIDVIGVELGGFVWGFFRGAVGGFLGVFGIAAGLCLAYV
jgi:hypothetical protein